MFYNNKKCKTFLRCTLAIIREKNLHFFGVLTYCKRTKSFYFVKKLGRREKRQIIVC